MMNIKRLFFFILCLLLPNWLGAKEWTTSDFNGEDYKFVFNILKLGEIVSDWTHVGNQYLLVEYDDEFYVCEIDARVINTTHMIIKCRDRRLKWKSFALSQLTFIQGIEILELFIKMEAKIALNQSSKFLTY